MKRFRVLVVHFSRTGNTTTVAERLERAFDGEIEPLVDRTDRRGLVGWVRSGLEALLHHPAEIVQPACDPADYDLVVIGSPVWASSLSSPVRAYLDHDRWRFNRVAFFVTCGGSGARKALQQMEEASGMRPVATLVVREHEIASGAYIRAVEEFARRVRALAAPRDLETPRSEPGVELRRSA